MIPHFISILTFDHKTFKKVINVCKYFSLKHANYALIFVVAFQYYLKDRLLWPFWRSFREIRILPCILTENMQDSVHTLFLFPFPASYEFHSRIFSQTKKNVWISEIRSATLTTLYVLSERKRRASSFLLFELQSHCPLAQAWQVSTYLSKSLKIRIKTYLFNYLNNYYIST